MAGQSSWGDYLGEIQDAVVAVAPARRRRSGFWLGFVSGAAVVVILGGAAAAVWFNSPGVTQASPAAPTTSAPTTSATSVAAPTTFGTLVIGETERDGSYERDAFGQSWADIDRNGCDTRNDILGRDLIDIEFKEGTNDCKVLAGTLVDSYSGETIAFVSGQTTSSEVQIDHIVPLAWAWYHGARDWTERDRETFANDPLNLVAVNGFDNQSKSDSGPALWMPPEAGFACDYLDSFVAVLVEYELTIGADDAAFISGADC